jgi:hypothetical protein
MGENPPNLVTLRTCVWCGKSLKREIKSVLYFILTESRLIGAELTNIFIAHGLEQGRQMVNFRTKNPTLGIFWRAWEGKMLVYFIVIWNILRQFGYVLWPLGMFCGPWVLIFSFLVHLINNNLAALVWRPTILTLQVKKRCPGFPPDKNKLRNTFGVNQTRAIFFFDESNLSFENFNLWESTLSIRISPWRRNKKTRVQIPPGYKVFRET